MNRVVLLISLTCLLPSTAGHARGIRNFREIFESYSAATQVPLAASLKTTFEQERDKLPRYGFIDELTPAVRKAMLTLASAFCEARAQADFQAEPSQRLFFPQVATGPSGDFSPAAVEQSFTLMARRFWGRTPSPAELQGMMEVAKEIAADANAAANRTAHAATLCLLVAASLESILVH